MGLQIREVTSEVLCLSALATVQVSQQSGCRLQTVLSLADPPLVFLEQESIEAGEEPEQDILITSLSSGRQA